MGVKLCKIADGARGYKRLLAPGPGPELSPVARRGYIPVAVGVNGEMKRFVIPTTIFGDADFLELLYRSAEEYGFCNDGVLKIPYEAKDFEEWMMRRAKTKLVRVKPA